MARYRGRRIPVPRIRTAGGWFGHGPQARDDIHGFWRPVTLLTRDEKGRRVSILPEDDSLDEVDEIDRKAPPSAQPVLPDPLYRVFDGSAYWLTADAEERDDALLDGGDRWDLAGYAYPDGDEETGLTLLRRLYKSSITTYLFTTASAEVTTALADGYVEQTPSVPVYVFTAAAQNRRPVYRSQHSSGRYIYATSLAEISSIGATWTFQGAGFYVLTGEERTIT